MSAELAFNRSQDVDYGVAQEVAPGIRRIVANNPGPYTFLGTNSYIVGSGDVAVIDPGPADEPDRRLADGDTVRAKSFALDVLHMPGHAPDHLCFALVGKRTMFTGDHVMGWNTTVIAPPEGNMADFLASLERLMPRHDKMFLPGHGGRIQTPQRVVKAYIMHRKWREQTILACLDEGVGTIPRIVARLYGTLDAGLKEAAALSVLAHLQQLISRNLVFA